MNHTPTSVLVLSILGILFGFFGILGLIWSMVVIFVSIGPPNVILEPLRHDTIYVTVSTLVGLVGMLAALLLIAASIGSLKLQRWARKGMLIYAWFAIIQAVLGLIFNITYVFPKMFGAMPSPAPPEAMGALIGGVAGGACGALFGMILPFCILYFFTRPKVKDAFNGIFPVSAFPVGTPPIPPQSP